MQKQTHEIYYFDEFHLDLTRGSFFRGAVELKLRPKSFDVLKYLAENSGRLISKEELIDAVWHETAVTDDSLVQCLKDIRHALGDDRQQIIKTVPRRGYVFEKEVSENGTEIYTEETTSVHLVVEETPEALGNDQPSTVLLGRRIAEFAWIGVAAASLAVLAAWWLYVKQDAENLPGMSAVLFQEVDVKSITHIGNVGNTAIAPDGKYIVFTKIDNGQESLWLRQIATDSTQLVIAPGDVRYFGVSFSRDQDFIYYVRAETKSPSEHVLFRIPTLGGIPERVLANLDWCPSFSPDGSQMTFVRGSETLNESVLMIARKDGSDERRLNVRTYNDPFGYTDWSPDGRMIAVSVGSVELGDSFRNVVVVNAADGSAKNLTTRSWYWIDKVAWLGDGSGLIMSANPEKSHVHNQVWIISYPSGESRQITGDSHNYTNISLTSDSRTILAGHTELLTHLWIAPGGDAVRARRISSGLGGYKHIRWTPDGKLLVSALGNKNVDIYLRSSDGTEIAQLTVNAGTNWGQEISQDNRYIVFESDRTGDFHIWRINSDGGDPVQLTNGSGEKFADISPDGKWVVYTAFQDWTLWKVPIEGGEPIQIAKSYARQATVSPDGKWIVYMASEYNRQTIMPYSGEGRIKIIDLPANAPLLQPVRWSPDSQAIQFIVKGDGAENIWQQSINGGVPKQVTNFTSDRIFSYDWSEDGEFVAFVRGAWTSDMVLLSAK